MFSSKRSCFAALLVLISFLMSPQLLRAQSVEELTKAAEQGDASALYALGDCYFFGRGVSQDYAEAVRWYTLAAAQWRADIVAQRSDVNLKHGASFQGSWPLFLQRNLKYPAQAIDQEIQGTVLVDFVIEKDGRVGEAKVLRSLYKECDEEAIRVIKLSRWNPAVDHNDKPVRVRHQQSIRFVLE